MKTILHILFLVLLMAVTDIYTQTLNYEIKDQTKKQPYLQEKPTQYRRGIKIQAGYQSYEQKYLGKNLAEEKRRAYPLNYSATTNGNKLLKATTGTGTWAELNPKVPRVDYVGVDFINKVYRMGMRRFRYNNKNN